MCPKCVQKHPPAPAVNGWAGVFKNALAADSGGGLWRGSPTATIFLMMKRFRLVVSSLAVFALTLGAITGIGVVPASAATVTVTFNNITYTADSTDRAAGATAASYTGVGGAVAIRDSVFIAGVDYTVRTIGNSAFSNKELTAVTIPDSVTTIGDAAFAGNRLTSVTIPYGVADIGSAAFASNALLTTVVLTSVLPPTITAADPSSGSFGAAAEKILYFFVPRSYPGAQWNGYTAAIEPAPVTDTVNSVTYSAYTTRPNDGATITAYDGAGGAVTLLDRVKISGVDFDVTTINDSDDIDGMFAGKGLTSVKLPAKATYIGLYAFAFNSLTTVIIPDSVTEIRAYAFRDNDLATIMLSAGITRIGQGAFEENQLTSVTLPNSLSHIDSDAFRYNRLTSITIPGSVGIVQNEAFKSNWLESVSIRSGVSQIWARAFEGNRLTTVTLPESVNTVELDAFNRNPMTSVLFMGPAPVVTTSRRNGPFGKPTGKTLYYLAANVAGFTSPWNGYKTVQAQTFTASPVPTITGTKKSGSTLTAVTGTWRAAPTTFSYVWNRAVSSTGEKTAIAGATSKTYKLTTADKGKFITVTVTASKVSYADTAKTSAAGGTKIAS